MSSYLPPRFRGLLGQPPKPEVGLVCFFLGCLLSGILLAMTWDVLVSAVYFLQHDYRGGFHASK